MGSISAHENASQELALDDSHENVKVAEASDNASNLLEENSNEDVLEKTSSNIVGSDPQNTSEVSSSSGNSAANNVNSDADTVSYSNSVVKIPTKVYAPAKTIKYKKNTYYKIKVLDNQNNPVKKVVLKVKVFTGKKSKIYSLKTTSKGIAKLKTRSLALGTHKITITTNNKNYKISKTTKIKIKKTVPKTKEKLSVSAPITHVTHKLSYYYTIKVKNGYADPVKKLKLKVKVYTGKKAKTYSIKTNSKGVAKLQTKKLSLGTHKVSISTTNKNYKVSKSTKIIVKRTGIVNLKTLLYYPDGNHYEAKLTWHSTSGHTYQVLKKTTGTYKVISTVKAKGATTSYKEKVGKNAQATYSVRESDAGYGISNYDTEGLTLLSCPSVDVDFQNLKAKITWSKVSDATKYRVFRKMGSGGDYKCIETVGSSQDSYTDWYYKSAKELDTILNSDVFADPSFNSLHYTVRACNEKVVNNVEKVSYGLYLKDGDFNLESPSIISLKNNKITWGKVPNAEGYIILKKSEGSSVWREIAIAGKSSSTQISFNIGSIDHNAYYAVQAFATKNGVQVYSNFDKGFTLKNYADTNSEHRVLYFGDSITFGSPYYSSSSIHVFSMPYRIAQLTGCVYYNPSIPGSTYHDLGVNPDGTNIENTDYYRYRITREVVDAIDAGELPGNYVKLDSAKNSEGVTHTKITDYNVVVLSAGTNDYLDNTQLGSINDSANNTFTFHGALNHILEKVKNASEVRIANNLSAIKVVFVDLFYSDRTIEYTQLHNRDITENKIGLTLMDYQKALDDQLLKWAEAGLKVFNFKTRDYNIVNSENCPYTASDNLHFTKFTYGQYGNAIAEFLVDNVFKSE